MQQSNICLPHRALRLRSGRPHDKSTLLTGGVCYAHLGREYEALGRHLSSYSLTRKGSSRSP